MPLHRPEPGVETVRAPELGRAAPCVRLVGCEPLTLGTEEDGAMGLSEPVRAAVDGAVELVEALIAEALGGT